MGNRRPILRALRADRRLLGATGLAGLALLVWAVAACSQEGWHFIYPEQRHLDIRTPAEMRTARLPELPPPPTVSDRQQSRDQRELSLDEAVCLALENSEVVRVLTGVAATSSGRTIYDPAIANTEIDSARARFDPAVGVDNVWSQNELPQGVPDPASPGGVRIDGATITDYDMRLGAQKVNPLGGRTALNLNVNPSRSDRDDLLLNPQTRSAMDLGYTQPLLQGGGFRANMAPLVIARINTERSFFQLKDSVQAMVRGVIEAYWALVFARTDLWARQQQVNQGEEAFERAEARLRSGLSNLRDVAQTRVALANFRANLVAAQSNALQREASLRNILGLPPQDACELVPTTPPANRHLETDWNSLVRLAEQQRPDLIELKLVIEADEQQCILARNQALPQLDAGALYRWNGLEGRTPDRTLVSSGPGDFTGWQAGINFSVPLGLRQGRAELRQQELIIARDRAELHQGLHQAVHALATSFRNLELAYQQYQAYREAREAARVNLEAQIADYRSGRATLYLNVLQAITDWGNAVSAEAQSLSQYNVELANLELQSGTILESHGIRFFEERYGSIGPLGRAFDDVCYPRASRPGPNADKYPKGDEPAENSFQLEDPLSRLNVRSAPPSTVLPSP